MSVQAQPQISPDIVMKDHQRIGQLVQEVEKLIHLLEEERLVEPSKMITLKRELSALKSGD